MRLILYFFIGAMLVFCVQTRKPHNVDTTSIKTVFRKSDNLLNRKDLQEIIASQSARDAESLISLFKDPDPVIRARAAFAMGSVQDPKALPGLMILLNDPVKEVRLDAAFAIRQNYGLPSSGTLVNQLITEKDQDVQSMLLEAIGFKGDKSVYNQIMELPLDHLSAAQALCAIYYLQQHSIMSQAGIDQMLTLLNHSDPTVRERAGYFFYTMTRKNVIIPQVADTLRKFIRRSSYHEVSIPYLLSYISIDPIPSDVQIFIDWSQNGGSLRTKSFAYTYMLPYVQNPLIRTALIDGALNPNYQLFMAAVQVLSECKQLTNTDLQQLRQIIDEQKITFNTLQFLLKALYDHNEIAFVFSTINNIPESDDLALITAISGLKELDLIPIWQKITRLSKSKSQQVVLLFGEYLASRLGRSTEDKLLPILDDVLKAPTFARIKSDILLAMAHNMKSHYSKIFRKQLFLEYYDHFVQADDPISASMCLVILGDIQDHAIESVLRKAADDPNKIIQQAGAGAISLLKADSARLIEVYRNEMRFTPTTEINWAFLRKFGRFPKFVVHTTKGDLVIQADVEQAPMGVQNLIEHVQSGLMDSIHIYRVETNHVVQFGTLGHSKQKVLAEFTRIPKVAFSVGIGHLGKDTGSQHLAICHLMRPHNEGLYTTFGILIEGHEVMMDINKYDLILHTEVIPN